jgi:spore coat polysaccharide biosynthesis protein SpsF (cytidylyltransferase family)
MRIVAMIQARAGGSRFPGKVFAKMGDRGDMLDRVIERVQRVTLDAALLVPFGQGTQFQGRGVRVIEGPEENVRARFLEAVDVLDLGERDIILRVTADDPFKDPDLMRVAANRVRDGETEYADTNHGNMTGVGAQAFTVAYLRRSGATEHVVPAKYDSVSLTVDTPEDLERVQRLTRAL